MIIVTVGSGQGMKHGKFFFSRKYIFGLTSPQLFTFFISGQTMKLLNIPPLPMILSILHQQPQTDLFPSK
jgi:hypothetical protein